jgi:hypothetical protein
MELLKKSRFLNSNSLKLLAAVSMFFDHLGLLFFPDVLWFRIIGRLSMPLFAFAIAEGCRYTKNKWKHFLLLFGLGAACQLVYLIFDPKTIYLGILITFSFSTLMIYALQFAKKCTFEEKPNLLRAVCAWLLFFILVAGVYIFCQKFTVDYKFYGCILPVCASIFDFHRIPAPDVLKKLDVLPLRVLCMAIPIALCMAIPSSPFLVSGMPWEITVYTAFTIPILLLYNGEKGKLNMKYFFYIFYPLHLGLLEGIAIAMMLF